jgi:hypothetical protein
MATFHIQMKMKNKKKIKIMKKILIILVMLLISISVKSSYNFLNLEEKYINDIPFNTEIIMPVEEYINDIPFNTEIIFIKNMMPVEEYIDDIPFDTRLIVDNINFQASITLKYNDIIEFRVEKQPADKVVLKIYSEKNNKIYQRIIKKNNCIIIKCDMSNMDNGKTYTCLIERNNQEIIKKSIIIN